MGGTRLQWSEAFGKKNKRTIDKRNRAMRAAEGKFLFAIALAKKQEETGFEYKFLDDFPARQQVISFMRNCRTSGVEQCGPVWVHKRVPDFFIHTPF